MRIFLLMILTAFSLLTACNFNEVRGPNGIIYKSPWQYNDYIINYQREIISKSGQLSTLLETNPDSAEIIRNIIVNKIDSIITDVRGMPLYKGDSSLRNAGINSFIFYKKMFSNEYKQIVAIFKKKAPMTPADAELIKDINYNISIEEEKVDKGLHKAQTEFARQNHMQLK